MNKYIVVSDSMMPLIPIGAELSIEPLEVGYKLKKFDILVFFIDEKLTCHFFWHQNAQYDKGLVVTRNLKTGGYDYPFKYENIIGLVKNYKISTFLKIKLLLRYKFVRL